SMRYRASTIVWLGRRVSQDEEFNRYATTAVDAAVGGVVWEFMLDVGSRIGRNGLEMGTVGGGMLRHRGSQSSLPHTRSPFPQTPRLYFCIVCIVPPNQLRLCQHTVIEIAGGDSSVSI